MRRPAGGTPLPPAPLAGRIFGRPRALGRPAGLALVTLALCGCQTTQQKSAELARKFHSSPITGHGLKIARASRYVKIAQTAVVHDPQGTAAVVEVQSNAGHALRDLPIAITLRAADGKVLFENNIPGLAPALTSVALLEAHKTFTWVDDQVPAGDYPATLTAEVGEGTDAAGPLPAVRAGELRLGEEGSAEGTVTNHSGIPQRNLVVFGVARKDGRIVGAGRAIVANLPAHGSSPFTLFFVGSPAGARLTASAPATTIE